MLSLATTNLICSTWVWQGVATRCIRYQLLCRRIFNNRSLGSSSAPHAQRRQIGSRRPSSTMAMSTKLKVCTGQMTEVGSAQAVINILGGALKDGLVFDDKLVGAALCALAKAKTTFADDVLESAVFETLLSETRRLLSSGNASPRVVGNVFWAAASLQRVCPDVAKLAPALIRRGTRCATAMNAQSVANTVWSLGVLQVRNRETEDLLQLLRKRCLEIKNDFTSQELANMCWGLAMQEQHDHQVMVAVGDIMAKRDLPRHAADLDLPQIACAFAVLSFWHDAFMQTAENSITPFLQDLNPWGLCALTWAYGELYPASKSCLDGTWKGKKSSGNIKGRRLQWLTESFLELEVLDERTCSLEVDGVKHTAEVSTCGQQLIWSHGGVWERVEQPFASFQQALRAEVVHRGLSDRVDHSRLGPDKWHSVS